MHQFGRYQCVLYSGAMTSTYPHSQYEALIRLLREARKERSIKQEDLSARLGKHRVFVTKYESGDRRLDVFELFAICHELSVDVHTLIDAVKGETPPEIRQHEEYVHGFCKGFLTAKGYEIQGGVFAEDVGV